MNTHNLQFLYWSRKKMCVCCLVTPMHKRIRPHGHNFAYHSRHLLSLKGLPDLNPSGPSLPLEHTCHTWHILPPIHLHTCTLAHATHGTSFHPTLSRPPPPRPAPPLAPRGSLRVHAPPGSALPREWVQLPPQRLSQSPQGVEELTPPQARAGHHGRAG